MGCSTGNISEVLKANGMPCFTLDSKSELREAIKNVQTLDNRQQNYSNMMQVCNALVVGESHINLFVSLVN